VIGIRSIGTGLAALVAAALGAAPPVTLRPVGHPFRREVRIADALADPLLAEPNRHFAIVDEGPGLSGSSFFAVADWLESRSIARERIHFFPSHPGDLGAQASDAHRARWARAARHWVSFEELFLGRGGPLESWVADLVGPLDGPLQDLSGGLWRAHRYARDEDWPAANVQQERRKYLARTKGASWFVKFAGLGGAGEAKRARARRLHEAGFGVATAGLRHGFLVERWIDAPSLDEASFDRAALIARLGAYLAFRVRAFPAPPESGASLEDLARMAVHKAGEALGSEAAAALSRRLAHAPRLENRVRRVVTDNRLHAQEWLVCAGRLVKTDALDHAATHDLVGCQDVAWDVAGAIAEFGLDAAEGEGLCDAVERGSGIGPGSDLLAFLRPCYLAFQLGSATLAAAAVGGREAMRLEAEARRYGGRLALELGTAGH